MKRFAILAAGVILASALSVSAFAQAAGPSGGGVQSKPPVSGAKAKQGQHWGVSRKLLKELNLTTEQQTKVKNLFAKYAAEAKAKTNTSANAKPDRKAMKARREQMMKDLNAILTTEQQTKLKELLAAQKNKVKKSKQTPPPSSAGGSGSGL